MCCRVVATLTFNKNTRMIESTTSFVRVLYMIEYYKNSDPRDLFYINENGLVCQEQWRHLIEYEGLYMVSNLGRVKSLSRTITVKTKKYTSIITLKEEIRKQVIGDKGYIKITVCKNGVRKSVSVHRLIAKTFIKNPLKKRTVNHKDEDGTKWYNVVWNLEWATHSENIKHGYDNNLYPSKKGVNAPWAKLNEVEVLEIRNLYASKIYTEKELSEIYKVHRKHILNIINRKTWKHI